MMNRMFLAVLVSVLTACGGGGGESAPAPSPQPAKHAGYAQTRVVSNAAVGAGMVYADGAWGYPDATGKWMIRGTTEDDAFMPAGWYLPADGPFAATPWWTLTPTSAGLLNSASPPAGNQYHGSFSNDAFMQPVFVKSQPLVFVDLQVLAFEGAKARVTVGISMVFPDGNSYYLERNVQRTESWDLCPDVRYERCIQNITYFPPAEGPVDVRALLLLSPGMTAEKADSLRILGVYIGSEIYGAGRVDVLIKNYEVRTL